MTTAFTVVDEFPRIPPNVLQQVFARASQDHSRLVLTANKLSRSHWSSQLIRTQAEKMGAEYIDSNTTENHALSDATLDFFDNALTGAQHTRLFENEYAAEAGLVIPRIHTTVAPWQPTRIRAGVDWGMSNPTLAVYAAQVANRWVIFDEYRYGPEDGPKTVAQIADEMIARQPGVEVWHPDPSAVELRNELRSRGQRVKPARNDIYATTRATREACLRGDVQFAIAQTPHLAEALASLEWDPDHAQKAKDHPFRGPKDPFDALRYLVPNLVHSHRPQTIPPAILNPRPSRGARGFPFPAARRAFS